LVPNQEIEDLFTEGICTW